MIMCVCVCVCMTQTAPRSKTNRSRLPCCRSGSVACWCWRVSVYDGERGRCTNRYYWRRKMTVRWRCSRACAKITAASASASAFFSRPASLTLATPEDRPALRRRPPRMRTEPKRAAGAEGWPPPQYAGIRGACLTDHLLPAPYGSATSTLGCLAFSLRLICNAGLVSVSAALPARRVGFSLPRLLLLRGGSSAPFSCFPALILHSVFTTWRAASGTRPSTTAP